MGPYKNIWNHQDEKMGCLNYLQENLMGCLNYLQENLMKNYRMFDRKANMETSHEGPRHLETHDSA